MPVPTFEVKVLGGEVEKVNYDATYAKEHADDPEVQRKWADYLREVALVNSEYNDRFGRMIILMGTEIDVPGEDSDWQKEQEFIGFLPPLVGSPERKIFYMMQSVLSDDRDVQRLAGEVLSLGRVDMEYVRLARESFRLDKKRETDKQAPQEAKRVEGKLTLQ